MNNPCTQILRINIFPPRDPQGVTTGGSHGVCLDPAGIEPLGSSRRFAPPRGDHVQQTDFPLAQHRLVPPENRLYVQTPTRRVNVSGLPLRGRTPTAKRCAPASRPASVWQGFPRCQMSLTLLRLLGATLRQETHCVRLLPRYRAWQSASSTPTRAAAGFS